MNILITGGAGFIGSALIRYLLENTSHNVINVDKLTYASNLQALKNAALHPHYIFEKVDICDEAKITSIFDIHCPDAVMHLAAESHVDRSIASPSAFIQSNIVGTYNLLEISKKYWAKLPPNKKNSFRFHHISTDEVFGDLGNSQGFFTEETAYAPSSPYSASKASSDHLVRAWARTYGLPTLISNCSNNYGPFQNEEKFIPKTIINALTGKSIPIYGNGEQVRDWLYVDDHVRALYQILQNGRPGETYNVGGHNEKQNKDIVYHICDLLESLAPKKPHGVLKYTDLICYINDRPGHDLRYAIDASKIKHQLNWLPQESFETGILKTVEWYLSYLNINHKTLAENII